MKKNTVKRGINLINIYEIEIDAKMRDKTFDFANKIILSNNQYLRLSPINNSNLELQKKIEIQRTYIGKLGELAFSKFLNEMMIEHSTAGIFDIYEGQTNVDSFDFKTKNNKTIDIKTGFRNIHKRLLINIEQFENIPKDYYVAVKLNAVDINTNSKLVDLKNITKAVILGYADYIYLKKYVKYSNFGEGLAKSVLYDKLLGIDRLLQLF